MTAVSRFRHTTQGWETIHQWLRGKPWSSEVSRNISSNSRWFYFLVKRWERLPVFFPVHPWLIDLPLGWPTAKPLSPCEGLPLLRRTGGPGKKNAFFQLACIADTPNRSHRQNIPMVKTISFNPLFPVCIAQCWPHSLSGLFLPLGLALEQ